MPHIAIEYSANLAERLDISGLLVALRDAAAATGILPLAGLRLRATACDHVLIADGNPEHAFIDIVLRLRAGRTATEKRRATEALFAAAEAYCAPVMAASSLMLSLETREIDDRLAPKASSIRRHLPEEMR